MNRRTLLKSLMLSPFLGLFKSHKSGASTELTEISETTGTSSDGATTMIWSVFDVTKDPEGNKLVVCDCDLCKKNPKPVFYKRVGRGNEKELSQ